METIERLRPAPEPRMDGFAARIRDESAPLDDPKAEQPEDVIRPVKLVEPEGRIFQARLSYDPIEADVFVEILDPTTGDVVRRLPAEKAADESGAFRDGGALVNQFA